MTPTDPVAPASELLPVTEQQALTNLKRGDITGLALLVQRYQVKAVHVALLIVRDRYLAEDIAQESFLQAYRKIDQYDEQRPFGPWFYRIVINAAIKTAHRQGRTTPLEEPDDGRQVDDWLIDPTQGPEELADLADLRKMIWQALEQLTPNQRAAVVLRYYLEKNEREMTQALDQPLTTVKWWLYAARQRLRKLLSTAQWDASEHQEVDHE